MESYKVWFPDDGETEDDATTLESVGPCDAAEESTDNRESGSGDEPRECFVRVKDAAGVVHEFDVEPEYSVSFWAKRRKVPK